MGRTFIRISALGSLFVTTMSGCLTPQSDALTGLIATNSAATSINSAGGDVYLAVDVAWEQADTEFTRMGTCKVDTGSAIRTNTCTIRIPEGRLFFSDVKLSFGTANSTTCHRVQFFPASWQASNSAAYVNAGAISSAAINCAAAAYITIPGIPGIPTGNVGCFSGPAKALYTSWPSPIGKYFTTSSTSTNEASETIASGNSFTTAPLLIDGNWIANLSVANKIDNPAASVLSPGGRDVYLANTMQPYRARCVDQYEQVQAEVIVYIADQDLETGEDPANPNNDQFYDFEQTL